MWHLNPGMGHLKHVVAEQTLNIVLQTDLIGNPASMAGLFLHGISERKQAMQKKCKLFCRSCMWGGIQSK